MGVESYAITKLSRGATGEANEGAYAMLDIAGNVDGKPFAFSVPDGIFAHVRDPEAFLRAMIASQTETHKPSVIGTGLSPSQFRGDAGEVA